MDLVIRENSSLDEDRITIECKKLTPKYLKAIDILKAQDTVVAYKNASIYKIDVDSIYYFECVDRNVFVYTEGDVYESRQMMNEIEDQMPDDFIRISRSQILNIQWIESLKPIMNGRLEAQLQNDEKVVVSRQYVKMLKSKFLHDEI